MENIGKKEIFGTKNMPKNKKFHNFAYFWHFHKKIHLICFKNKKWDRLIPYNLDFETKIFFSTGVTLRKKITKMACAHSKSENFWKNF